jgi:hypothetical protein
MTGMTGLEFVAGELAKLQAGICPACEAPLPEWAARSRSYTCDDVCHAAWIASIIQWCGETREITHLESGKVYAVPTRVILEQGITGSDLDKYPEVVRLESEDP